MTWRAVKRWPFVFLLLGWVGLGALAPALAKDLPIPALTGRVVDQASILSQQQERDLTSKLAALERKSGDQVVVVTLKSLQGRPIEDWGMALGRGWGIGQKGKDNGVLLIVAPNDRELRIEVGYGLEGTLPDATANAIINNVIVPRFKAGNMYGGINDGVDAIGGMLAGEAPAFASKSANVSSSKQLPFMPIAVLFFAAFVLVVAHVKSDRRRRRRRLGDNDNDDDDNSSGWYWGGSSWSSSDSSSSSSGGGFGGGGFSGGGGSFGGGGSSGRW